MFTGFLLVLVPAQLDSAGACSLLGLKSCTDRYTPQPYPHLPDVRALDPVASTSGFLAPRAALSRPAIEVL